MAALWSIKSAKLEIKSKEWGSAKQAVICSVSSLVFRWFAYKVRWHKTLVSSLHKPRLAPLHKLRGGK